jgi:predicted ATP-grasp superfamily ATP-dependent carboligase
METELHNFIPRQGLSSPVVLVLQVENHIGLTLARALGRQGITCLGVSYKGHAFGCSSRYLKGYAVCQPLSEKEMMATTIQLIDMAQPDFVMAVSESLMKQLNAHRSLLPAQTKLLFAEQHILDRAFDKSSALSIARRLHIPTPASYSPEEIWNTKSLPAEAGFPVVLKPPRAYEDHPWKARSFQYKHCSSAREVLDLLERFSGAPYFPLVQQYCPGHGVGVELCMHEGKPIAAFQHERMRENPPTGGVSVMRRSTPVTQALFKDSVRLLRAMEWKGVAMVEYRYDPQTNQYWLMEVNGRFWGSLSLPVVCGVNFPYILLESMGYGRLPKRKMGEYPVGVKCQQLSADLHWLITVGRMTSDRVYKEVGMTKWQCIRSVLIDVLTCPYRDVEWLDDLLPAIHFWKERIANALSRNQAPRAVRPSMAEVPKKG